MLSAVVLTTKIICLFFGEEQELSLTKAGKCEAYACNSSKKTSTADELLYLMFCQKKQKNEMLRPTSDSLLQHLKRSNYQAFVWRHAPEAMQDLGPAEPRVMDG